MKSIYFYIIIIFSVFYFAPRVTEAGLGVYVEVQSPAPSMSYSNPVSISGRARFVNDGGNWNCTQAFSVIQYKYDNPDLFNGSIVFVPYLPRSTWLNFNQATASFGSPPVNLSPGPHTLYWRYVSGVDPVWGAGSLCGSPTYSVSFRVLDSSQTPSISFLLNGAPQDITLNTPQETFSYTVSASGNATRCYTYKEDWFGTSGSWTQTGCNQNYSNISLDGLASSLATFLLGHPIEGENRYYVRAWNLAGGYSPTVERRITVATGLPTVSLRNDPPLGNFGDTTGIMWTVDNADSCTVSSNPAQAWWNGVDVTSTLGFGGFSDNSFSPIPTPPVTETYELTLSCSNTRGTATARLPIIPQVTGYCGDGFVYRGAGFDQEQCDLGALNGQVGSGCDNSCRIQLGLDFSLSADQAEVIWPSSATIRSRLVNSGGIGNNMFCNATNLPEGNSNWNSSINISTGADTVRVINGLSVGLHTFNLECDNGIEVVNKNVNVNVVRRTNGFCGSDAYQTLLSTPTNLCDAGRADPTIPTFDTLTQNWNWQCLATGGATINRSCWATKQQPPEVLSVAMRNSLNTDNSNVYADGTRYKITMRIIDYDQLEGGNNIDNAFAVINMQGTNGFNASNERGYIGWSSNNFPTWNGNYAEGPINCNVGRAAIYGGNGDQYINLHSCSTNVSGSLRDITFDVSFNPSFVAPVTNELSGFATNKDDLFFNWAQFNQFSLLNSAPPPPVTNGQCGSADGKKRFTIPTGSVLCNVGNSTAVNGTGPWTWQCRGTGGGSDSRICRADKYKVGFSESN